ncbi:MAG: DedA family protein [Patescibacteria group bacterium]|nr:DedA family protein [Patescibacteria group bacterium]
MHLSITEITNLLIQYRYFILFPIVVFEGPIITVVAGFLTSLGYFNFFIVYAVAVAGDLAGDVLHYAIGYWGGEKFIRKYGHYFFMDEKRIIKLEKSFERNGNKMLFIGKIAHGAGGAFLIAAGLVKMPFREFMRANLLATVLKSLILLLLGFYYGAFLSKINSYFDFIAAIFIGAVIIVAVIYFFYYPKKNEGKTD